MRKGLTGFEDRQITSKNWGHFSHPTSARHEPYERATATKPFDESAAMNVAEFGYTTLLRPTWLRAQVNRLIIALLPASLRVGSAVVVLNPHDPVVSGALALGLYERCEIALMQRLCKPGQVMVDIGANVGLYTAIAGPALGPSGRAMEPEPESLVPTPFASCDSSGLGGCASMEFRSAAGWFR